ncbi:hypothetical protein [Bacillus salipaludis]|uniref:Uncharacterized protein n=1 Tax=Bacillus salipaludis TaxID=2547811 RepID=A0AA90TUG8_9BACI|nr:hypothetical protein [Bacillus salipaludis]MDQ6599834.1 hypothetical protein [Bacillus salipaludis]
MDKLKNEEGYALITVLLIIVIFMVIFVSFMGQAFSSTKQNQVVEKTSHSVALAEMGVSYYKVEVQRVFESKQQSVNDQVINILKTDPQKDYKTEATRLMKDALQQDLGQTKPAVTIDGYPNATFTMKNFLATVISGTNKVRTTFDIVGTENGKNTTLNAEMEIDLKDINLEGGSITPEYNAVPKPENVSSTCTNPTTFSNISCPNGILINQDMTYSENYNGYVGTIYSTADLALNGNGNKSNLILHADSVSLKGNLNSLTNLTLETEHDASFGGQLRVDSSHIYIGGNMVTDDHVTLATSSSLFARGNATIGKSLTIDSTSKMCVNGNFKADDLTINTSGKLFVKGTVTVTKGIPSGTQIIKVTDPTDTYVRQQCGNTFDEYNSIDWKTTTGTVVNNVDYK